jgi:transposase
LESVARSGTSQHRLVQRARVLLAAADGLSNSEIASRVGVSRPTVLAWRAEFAQRGLWRFGQVAPGRGRKPSIPQEIVDRVVELTLHHRPEGATHWSVRSMARQVGISPLRASRAPQIAAVGVVVDPLRDPAQSGPPRLSVVHEQLFYKLAVRAVGKLRLRRHPEHLRHRIPRHG